jgi:hypothetical protein
MIEQGLVGETSRQGQSMRVGGRTGRWLVRRDRGGRSAGGARQFSPTTTVPSHPPRIDWSTLLVALLILGSKILFDFFSLCRGVGVNGPHGSL